MHDLLEYLYGLERWGIKPGLAPTRELLKRAGNPHLAYDIVQVAGTNGKGSTCAITAQVLRQHGLKVGLYTSPHLVRFNERIRVNGRFIEDEYIVQWTRAHRADLEETQATFFEATTVMALSYFQDRQVETAVLETGLGGRLDATTATAPRWTALTPIDIDHTDMLGTSVEEIAREKAGILRAGVPCFSVPQAPPIEDIIREEASRSGVPLRFVTIEEDLPVPKHLAGGHQRTNASLGRALAREILGQCYDSALARRAIEEVRWPGRYQVLREEPCVIFDVGHNPHGVAAFLDTFRGEARTGTRWLVLAVQQGKHPESVLAMVREAFDRIVFTQTGTRQYIPAAELARLAGYHRPFFEVESDPERAILHVLERAEDDDLVVILGSHYLGPAVAGALNFSFDIES
jgi:dihydrofolate synthase/folylpolyglutamate synthase